MKASSASIALLGLPAALAGVVIPPNNATPTRPDIALGLPTPSPQPTAYGALVEEGKQEVAEINESGEDEHRNTWNWHDFLRLRRGEALPTIHNTFTHINKTTSTSTPAVTAATEIAIFTAAGAIFTVTEVSGMAAVDGKSLTPGGPAQLIGGEYISEASSGAIVVNGQTLSLQAYSSSSQPAPPPVASSSSAAAASSSSATGKAATTKTSPGAAVMQTAAAANVVALVGAVVGAIVL